MEFRKFSSIENVGHLKTMQEIQSQGIPTNDWIITEKVHGANFSIWTNGEHVRFAKRSGFIDSKENFYDYQTIAGDLHDKVMNLFKTFNPDDVSILTVYGELFGGNFTHPDVKNYNVKSIQKGIQYSPKIEFMAFDIALNGELMPKDAMDFMCKQFDIFYAKPLFRGTLDECLNQSNEYDSTIPASLGYPHLKDNICEGNVLMPTIPIRFGNESRVILKNKNEKWSEKAARKKVPKDLIKMSDEQKLLVAELASYVTENRLRNVLSKIGEITQKDFGKLQGLFIQDILEDYQKDADISIPNLDRKEWKMINKELGKIASGLIRKNFRNIIDGVF